MTLRRQFTARRGPRARLAACAAAILLAVTPVAAAPFSAAAPPAGFVSHTTRVGDVSIHYVIGGKGPPLLLLHGWPETWFEWRLMMPALAKSHTVIAADLRGMGGSSLASEGYDKKTLANDMHALVSQLGYQRVTVIGHDWGGPVAYAYAAQHRDAVDKLVMIEGSPFGPWMRNTNVYWFFDFLGVPGYAETVLPGRERAFLRYFYENEAFHAVPGVFTDETIEVYSGAYARPGGMTASYGLYRTIGQDVRDVGAFAAMPLSIPVLAVGAEKGAGAFVGDSARRVASNVQTVIFKGTGHFVPEERPAELTDVVMRFLRGETVAGEWRPQEGPEAEH